MTNEPPIKRDDKAGEPDEEWGEFRDPSTVAGTGTPDDARSWGTRDFPAGREGDAPGGDEPS
jgi:hypothetical protein